MNYLQVDGGEYPVLKLTPLSEGVLKGLQKVEFIESEIIEDKHDAEQLRYEAELFNELKSIRRDIALHENVPAYVILSDSTLQEIAIYLPQSLDELRMISGFGDVKLARYGREFVLPVKEYAAKKGLSSKIKEKKQKRERKSKRVEGPSETQKETLGMYRSGLDIAGIAAQRKLSPMTVEGHLTAFVQTGDIDVSNFVSFEKLKVIQEAVESYGDLMLSPLKEILGEDYSYTEIKATIAWMKGQMNAE